MEGLVALAALENTWDRMWEELGEEVALESAAREGAASGDEPREGAASGDESPPAGRRKPRRPPRRARPWTAAAISEICAEYEVAHGRIVADLESNISEASALRARLGEHEANEGAARRLECIIIEFRRRLARHAVNYARIRASRSTRAVEKMRQTITLAPIARFTQSAI